jgi:hypothetical protein
MTTKLVKIARSATLTMAFAILALQACASERTKTFNGNADQVFQAALRVARENQGVSKLSESKKSFRFKTAPSMETLGYNCDVSVRSVDQTRAKLTIIFHLKIPFQLKQHEEPDRISDQFFARVQQELEKTELKNGT